LRQAQPVRYHRVMAKSAAQTQTAGGKKPPGKSSRAGGKAAKARAGRASTGRTGKKPC
jgi:hypothetical protein